MHRIVGVQLMQHEVGVPDNDGQEVVEVVGDATGEPPDRLHLVKLPGLLLRAFPFSDVLDDGDEVVRFPAHVAVEPDGQSGPHEAPVFAPIPFVPRIPIDVARDQARPGVHVLCDFVRVRDRHEIQGREFVGCIAEQLAEAAVHEQEAAVQACLRQADQGLLEDRLIDGFTIEAVDEFAIQVHGGRPRSFEVMDAGPAIRATAQFADKQYLGRSKDNPH